jgi:cob(I)alamin adenosyltransferase
VKIYTRTGDKGLTSLFGGERVSKDTDRIEAYGNVDELNSWLGVVLSLKPPREVDSILRRIQNELFILGSDLATPETKRGKKALRITTSHIEQLERDIDTLESSLTPLEHFILPGGTRTAAELHVARTICRRAERSIVRLSRKTEIRITPVVYVNRLSDLLFVAARSVNKSEGGDETQWTPAKET